MLPKIFALNMFEILRFCSGWCLLNLSQQIKSIFKVGNIVKNIAVIDVILTSLLQYLEIMLGWKTHKHWLQLLLLAQDLVKFSGKHLCRFLFLNKVAD